jgi:hypothetical protein
MYGQCANETWWYGQSDNTSIILIYTQSFVDRKLYNTQWFDTLL